MLAYESLAPAQAIFTVQACVRYEVIVLKYYSEISVRYDAFRAFIF